MSRAETCTDCTWYPQYGIEFCPLHAHAADYKEALESLTPLGSEFVNDPQRCVEAVREYQNGQHQQIVKMKKQRDDYRVALERIRAMEHNGECPYEDDNDNPCDCHVALADAALKGDG